MKDLKFDIYALTNPKTSEDILALLNEALIELEQMATLLEDLLNNA